MIQSADCKRDTQILVNGTSNYKELARVDPNQVQFLARSMMNGDDR